MLTPREDALVHALGHLIVDYRITNPALADGAGNLLQAEAVLDEILGYEESAAIREGWLLRPDSSGRIDIRCLRDDPDDHFDGCDDQALCHVMARAAEGSARHLTALRLIGRLDKS